MDIIMKGKDNFILKSYNILMFLYNPLKIEKHALPIH